MSQALAIARRNSCGWQPAFAVCNTNPSPTPTPTPTPNPSPSPSPSPNPDQVCDFDAMGEEGVNTDELSCAAGEAVSIATDGALTLTLTLPLPLALTLTLTP